MKKKVIFFGLFHLFGLHLYAQRSADIVMDPFPSAYSVILSGRTSYLAPLDGSSLFTYRGEELEIYNYPVISGERLTCGREGIAKVSSGIYLNLMQAWQRHVYRYSSGIFLKVPFPGEIISSFAVFNDEIYVISRAVWGSPATLYKYDGRTVTEVSELTMLGYAELKLFVGAPYLYVCGPGPGPSRGKIFRYDGLSFIEIPTGSDRFGRINIDNIREIHTLSGTEDTYIHDFYSIFYYNGTTTERVYSEFPADRSDLKEWRGKIWIYVTIHPFEEPHLVSILGGEYQDVILPEGYSLIPRSGLGIFRDTLYVAAKSPDNSLVLLYYNDTTFTQVMEFSDPPAKTFFYPREDGLVVLPDFRNQRKAYLYNTGDTDTIYAPEDYVLYAYYISSGCYHLWGIMQRDMAGFQSALAVEKYNCPSDTREPNYIIPESLQDYAKVDLYLNGKNRNWCWSEIILNWQINPICPTLQTCPDPLFRFALIDVKGNRVWEKEYRYPLQVSLPIKDQQAYQLALYTGKKEVEPIMVFDQSLVRKGIEEIGIKIDPVKEEVILQVSSQKKKATGFRLALLDQQGKKVWEEKYQAPFEKQIRLNTKLPGTTLFFSADEKVPGKKMINDSSKMKK